VLADARDGVALIVIQGEEFDFLAQASTIADDGAHSDTPGGVSGRRFQGHNLADVDGARALSATGWLSGQQLVRAFDPFTGSARGVVG
jgi:hypothetical protein